jgi:hypothetical protein
MLNNCGKNKYWSVVHVCMISSGDFNLKAYKIDTLCDIAAHGFQPTDTNSVEGGFSLASRVGARGFISYLGYIVELWIRML